MGQDISSVRAPGQLPALLQVQLTVSPLPALSADDELLCLFGEPPPHPARVEGDTVICNSPSSIPSTQPGEGEDVGRGAW